MELFNVPMLANTQKMKHQAPRQYLSALRTEQIEMFGKTGRKAKRMLAEKETKFEAIGAILCQAISYFVKSHFHGRTFFLMPQFVRPWDLTLSDTF